VEIPEETFIASGITIYTIYKTPHPEESSINIYISSKRENLWNLMSHQINQKISESSCP